MKALRVADGMVGQIKAREAAGLIVNMAKEGKLAGKAILLAGPPGTGKCVIGDTPVLLGDGSLIEIEKIFEEAVRDGETVKLSENEVLVKPNKKITVISLNLNTLRFEDQDISYVYRQKVEEPLFKVVTRSGRSITVTGEHPFLTIEDGEIRFVRARELRAGSHIAVPRRVQVSPSNDLQLKKDARENSERSVRYILSRRAQRERAIILRDGGASYREIAREFKVCPETARKWVIKDMPYLESLDDLEKPFLVRYSLYSRTLPIEAPSSVTPELAEFIGYLLSECDEYVDEKGHIYSIRFHNTDEALLRRFEHLVRKLFKLRTHRITYDRTPAVRVNSWSLAEYLKAIGYNVGRRARHKDVPNFILRSDDECVRAFLRAFCEGESDISDEEISINTSSENIANKLAYLLLRFGIVARIRKREISVNGENRIYYRIVVSGGEFVKKFREEIGFLTKKRRERLETLHKRASSTNVDFIPGVRKRLKIAREKLQKSKGEFYGSKGGYRYELPPNNKNFRRISRKMLQGVVKDNKIGNSEVLHKLAFSDIFWDYVKEVHMIESDHQIYVYDLCVNEESPTFIAGFGGMVVHNTAIAVAMARELGRDVPFIAITGSEIYSAERKKTDVLMDAMRQAIGVRIREMRDIYEGEVTDIHVRWASNPYNPYQKVPESVRITLETKDEKKTIEAGQSVAYTVVQNGIREGDVIQIDADTGRISRVGVSEKVGKRYDIGEAEVVPRPSGPVLKKKEFVYTLTLADLDELFMKRRGGGFFSLLFGGATEKEIDPEVRATVDQQVKEWVEQRRAEIIPGVLFIDNIHMMDIEALSFLTRAMEGELVPIIVMATNRGITTIRGTNEKAPFGLPLDLLDRLVIITTEKYDPDEIEEILRIRMKEEDIKADDEALALLKEIGGATSLRHAVQVLSIAGVKARANGRDKISAKDVEDVKSLFRNVADAVEYLKRYESELLK